MDHTDRNKRRIQQEARRRAKKRGIKYTEAYRQIKKEVEAKYD